MRWTSRRARLAALAIPIAVFAIKFRYVGSGDTVPAELLPIRILEHGTLTFPAPASARPPYWFHPGPHGLVSSYPILPGLVNVPAYAAARAAGIGLETHERFLSHVTAALCSVLSVFFVYLVLERLLRTPSRALGFALLYAFGTEVWSMASRGLFQHGPALMFLSAGLYALLRDDARTDLAAGGLLCLAVLTRSTSALLVAPLVVWAARAAPRRLFALAAGAAVPALLHAAYAWRYWGSPFSLAQPVTAAGFTGNAQEGLSGLLVSPSRGLFVFSPVFLFAIPAAVRAFRRSAGPHAPLVRALVVGTLLTVGLYSRWSNWWGGHSFGYRLLAELALPLTILIAWDWDRIRTSRPACALFVVTAAISVVVHGLGSAEYPSRFNDDIDREPERLWDVRDSELAMCARKALHLRVPAAEDALAPWLRPVAAPSAAWWSFERDAPDILAALDAPAGGIVRGPLAVLGWAQPSPGDAGEVLVSLAPGDRRFRPARFPRPDVAAMFPHLGDASEAGFGLRLEPPARLEARTVLLEVRDRAGRVTRRGPVSLLWGPARRGVHEDLPLEHAAPAVPAHDRHLQAVPAGR